jgi:glycosyltransferase involved in cell wall biosynthesis
MNNSLKNGNQIGVWFVTGGLPPHFSGAGKNDLLLAPLCSANGLGITLVTSRQPGDPFRDVINGVPVLRIARGDYTISLRFLGSLRFMRLLSLEPHPSIIRFRGFSFRTSLIISMIKLFYHDIKIIVQPAMFGGDDAFSIQKKTFGSFLIRQIFRADAIFSMNALIGDSFRELGYPANRIYPVNNPIDVDTFYPLSLNEKLALRQQLGLAEDAFIFITSGILSTRKKQSLVTEAFLRRLSTCNKNAYLIHMGPTADELGKVDRLDATHDARIEENAINSLLCTSEHRDRVLLVGHQKNPELYLQASDVFVHASCYEGEANVVNEALACGLPGLLPDLALYKEQAPPACSVRYAADSSDALSRAMAGLLSDSDRHESMAIVAKQHIIKTRHPEFIAKHYAEIIRSIVNV